MNVQGFPLRAAARSFADFSGSGRIAVAEIEPKRSVRAQNAARFAEDQNLMSDEQFEGWFSRP